jgi:hypothetical protein
MITQIIQDTLSKESRRVYNWCLKNLPDKGVKIIEESFKKFLETASLDVNRPIDKLSQEILRDFLKIHLYNKELTKFFVLL